MTMDKILNKAQADSVYAAMVALNNVYGRITARIPIKQGGHKIEVHERLDGSVTVAYSWGGAVRDVERYANQHAFAVTYGLDA
jgi:hypothetical protein